MPEGDAENNAAVPIRAAKALFHKFFVRPPKRIDQRITFRPMVMGGYMMTPKELNKSMTILLNDLLAATGFSKKRIGRLIRKEKGCQQFFTFYFTRARFSNCYAFTANLMFSFPEIDKLASQFLDQEYDPLFPTGCKPFYTVVPGQPVLKYKYFSDKPLEQFAELVAHDFRLYALPFYEQFNTVHKLETYFDRLQKEGIRLEFSVQTGKQGRGSGCCIAAVLCILEKWDKLQRFLNETELLSEEHRERIAEYMSNRSLPPSCSES